MSDDSYVVTGYVGYGHPPKENQFKPGQSGNPAGRSKKKKLYDMKEVLVDELNNEIIMKESGICVKITKMDAICKRLVNKAASGDSKAIKLIFDMSKNSKEEETLDRRPLMIIRPPEGPLPPMPPIFGENDEDED